MQPRILSNAKFRKSWNAVCHIGTLAELTDEELSQVEAVFTYGDHMPPELIRKMTSLRWVHSGQSGIEAMPQEVLAEMGVHVTNSRGINAVTIAEYVFCTLLNITRNNYVFYEAFKRREWDMTTHLDEIIGKTMTIFGIGKVGREIAKRAAAFGMRVFGVDPISENDANIERIVKPEAMDEVIPGSDVIVICMPLTDSTRNLFTYRVFESMKRDVIFMNVGRGPIVNREDFIRAMRDGLIGHAVIDVFDQEPLMEDDPLWTLERIYITPHIAGDRQASYQPNMMRILCDNLKRYPDFDSMINPVGLLRGF